ncbi:hypothetical protein NQZ68_025858 [Dissostichus eleginoides]|nr:hypothetical protein NQZ68_025858 [Dissostichus eleginoides]
MAQLSLSEAQSESVAQGLLSRSQSPHQASQLLQPDLMSAGWFQCSIHCQSGTAAQTPETYIKDRGVLEEERRGDRMSGQACLATE